MARISFYWLGVLFLVLLMGAAILLVLAGGSHAQLQIATMSPRNDAPISSRPVWRLTFEQPLDQTSLQNAIAFSPTLPIDMQWVEDEFQIRPRHALRPGARYQLIIRSGVMTLDGVQLQSTLQWTYETRESRIAFLAPGIFGNGQLWVVDLEGNPIHKPSGGYDGARDFDPMPHGDVLLVADMSSEVITADVNPEGYLGPQDELSWTIVDGAGTHAIAREEKVLYEEIQVHPSGDTVAIQVRREVQLGDQGSQLGLPRLYLYSTDNGEQLQLIYGGGPNVANTPRWAPSGNLLAFYDTDLGSIGLTDLQNPPTFFDAVGASLGEQAWSPDSLFLVYTLPDPVDRNRPDTMVVRDIETGNEQILITPNITPRSPAFNHNGTLLAYSFEAQEGEGRRGGIGIIRTNGTGQQVLISEPGTTFSQPLWSPDGEWLLFGRFKRAEGQTTQGLWVMRRDGSEAHQIAPIGLRAKWVP